MPQYNRYLRRYLHSTLEAAIAPVAGQSKEKTETRNERAMEIEVPSGAKWDFSSFELLALEIENIIFRIRDK